MDEKEVNFSLSYEQLTRIAETRIRECELASQGGEQEERQDEHARRDGREHTFGLFRIVDRIDDEQHHSRLVEVVIEGVEQLRHEQRQKPPLAQ